jgi:hypothetical protein
VVVGINSKQKAMILLTLYAIYIIANFEKEPYYSIEDLNDLHPET